MAQEQAAPADSSLVSFTLTTTLFNQYLGANGDIFYDGPVIQPDLFIAFPNGLYADVWVSRADGNLGEDFGDELDLTVGWSNERLDVSAARFWVLGGDVAQLKAVFAPWLLDYGANSFILDTKIEYYWPTASGGPAEGTMLRIGLSYSRQLSERWSLSQRGGVFWDSGAFGYERGYLAEWRGGVSFSWKGMSIGPVVKFTTPIDLDHDINAAPRSTQWAFGFTVSKNF